MGTFVGKSSCIRKLWAILERNETNMRNKYKLTFSYLIAVLAIFSCSNTDSGKNKLLDTTTPQTANKQTTELKSTLNIGGTYSFGDNVEKGPVGSVILYPLTDSSALFFLDVCRGAPSYNLGQLFGQMTIKNDIGIYDSRVDGDDFNCVLRFEFSSEQLKVTTDNGHDDCGFGHAVYADHTYRQLDKSIPQYFIDGQVDTTFFKGMTVEKYLHRFD